MGESDKNWKDLSHHVGIVFQLKHQDALGQISLTSKLVEDVKTRKDDTIDTECLLHYTTN